MKPSLPTALAIAFACVSLAAPASAQSRDGRDRAAPITMPAPADVRQDRIEELERQLQESTAAQEDLQRQLIEAQREVARLQAMVNDLAVVRDAHDAAQTGQGGGGAAPASPPAAPVDQAPAPRAQAAPPPASPPPPAQVGQLGTLPASDLPGDAGEAYSRARTLLTNGRLAEAEAAFQDFLTRFADAPTAADGRFWYAFTLLARNNYEPAAQGFLDYLRRTPSGPRAPEALVRLGMALGGMDRTDQACGAFRDLPRRYPHAAQAVRDLAARESRALRCPTT